MNNFFSKAVENLNITGYKNFTEVDGSLNIIDQHISKFKTSKYSENKRKGHQKGIYF